MAKLAKYRKAIIDCKECILSGHLLAIDPSTGSASSMPGYAIFKAGELIESGIITVNLNWNRSEKLNYICTVLKRDFKQPDILAIESPGQFIGKMSSASVISLQRAIGAIESVWAMNCLVEVPANSWQKYAYKGYVKGDSADSICIGLCVLAIAKEA